MSRTNFFNEFIDRMMFAFWCTEGRARARNRTKPGEFYEKLPEETKNILKGLTAEDTMVRDDVIRNLV